MKYKGHAIGEKPGNEAKDITCGSEEYVASMHQLEGHQTQEYVSQTVTSGHLQSVAVGVASRHRACRPSSLVDRCSKLYV